MKQMRTAEQNNATLVAEITEQNMELNMTIDALRNDLQNRCQSHRVGTGAG